MNDVTAAVAAAAVPAPSPLRAPSVLLMGEIGSGKTEAVKTILAAGLEVFYLGTEPGYEDILGATDPNRLHWNYVAPLQDDMTIVKTKAELIRDNTDQGLKAMGGVNKPRHTQIFDFMALCNDFVDLRTGQHFGDVCSWGPERCFYLDGLDGLTKMAVKLKIGDKPFMEQNDYLAAQSVIRDIVNTLTTGTRCLFVMTSHVEMEPDPMTGLRRIMPSTVGQKLSPDLPKYFSDAIITKRQVVNGQVRFLWDNMDPNAVVKQRNLPWNSTHPADFGPLITNWRKKVAN